MDTFTTFIYLLTGLLLRLAIPIAATVLLVFLLRKLDRRWQAEAELQPMAIEKPECWKIKGCPPEKVENCAAVKSNLPCWQVNRLSNGYLNEKCLSCEVFVKAPVPATIQAEPRSL